MSYDSSLFSIAEECSRLDVRTNKWEAMPSMLFKSSLFSIAEECSRLDIRTNKWEAMPSMLFKSSLFSIAEECSRLDIRTNKWEAMPSMLFKRLDYSAAIIADDIYVFGGASKADTDGEFINSVERYNIHNNEWTAVDSVEVEVCGGAAAVISGDFKM
ncbi:uncharacterized protein ACN427_004054 [Glossina fuscipes fuscipes]